MSSVRVGVLAGEAMIAWKIEAIRRMLNETDAELTLIVQEQSRANSHEATAGDRIKAATSDGLWGLHRLPVGKLTKNRPYERSQRIDDVDCFAGVERRRCYPQSADGVWNTLPDEVVATISAETDVLIRDAFGLLKGDVLTATEYGVWSFHGGDIRKYRGKPAGFWEFMNDEPEVGVTLQRINETLDGGEIVAFKTVDITDAYTWQEVKSYVYRAVVTLLTQGVTNIQDPEFEPKTVDELGAVYTTPDAVETIRYLLKNNTGRVKRFLDQR